MTEPDLHHPASCPYCGATLPEDSFICTECRNITVYRDKKQVKNKSAVTLLILIISILLILLFFRIWQITVQHNF